jgi:predicted Mrr-cat superfamily restriction endonuclease
MRTCWLIRAGDANKFAEEFVSHGIVAVSWSNVEGLADIAQLTPIEVERIFEASELPRFQQHSSQLLQFRDDVAVGDVVVTPSAERGVLVGEITSPYQWLEQSPTIDYRHTRTARWDADFERDHLPGYLAKELNWRSTLRSLTYQDEWLDLAERAKDGEGRRPQAGRRKKPVRGLVTRTTRAEPRERLCPACHNLKSVAQFGDGDICVDCR